MSPIEASGSQLLTTPELVKLSQSASFMTVLVSRDKRPIAVIKSFMYYGKNFESSHNASSGEARVSDIGKALVFFKFLHGAAEATYRRYFRVMKLIRR